MATVAQPRQTQDEEQQKKQQDERKQDGRAKRARLVQRLVSNDGDLPQFMHDLITTQAVVVAGTESAAFLLEQGQSGKTELRTVAHVRPDNSEEGIRRQAIMAFREIVTQCVSEDKDGALRIDEGSNDVEPQFCLVTLLRNNEERVVAVTACVTRCKDEGRALQRLSTMQLVAGYFDMFLLKRSGQQDRQIAKTHQDVFQFASTVATAENFHASAAGLCNELASRAGASRVAVGWVRQGIKNPTVKLEAISHTEEFDKKQELSVQLVKVMEECLDQDEFTQFDPAGTSTDNVTREAMALSQMEGGSRVASLPLRRMEKIVGILTLEFPAEKPATPQEATALAVTAELLAPQLYDRFANDRYLVTKAGISAFEGTKQVAGLRQHTLAKLIILGVAGLLAFLCLYSPMYRVSAPFSFVPTRQRIIDAPYQGTIEDVMVEVGDVVKAGDVLAVLDTREVENERLAALKEAQAAEAQANAYLGQLDKEPGSLANYQAKQKEAESQRAKVALLDDKIDRASIKATIDGVILSVPGNLDLKERIGSVVQPGDKLIVLGDPSKLKLEVSVADRDIQRVWPTQTGSFATSAQPDLKIPLTVDRIVDAAQAQQGKNAFTVYALADATPEQAANWRPSATGEARFDVGNRPLIWQWTHRAVDWVRLKLWI